MIAGERSWNVRQAVRQIVSHGLVLAALTAPAAAESRACIVTDVRFVTALQKLGASLVCENGRFTAGVVDDGLTYRGVMVCRAPARCEDRVDLWKTGDLREGQIYLCRETVKTLPATWDCQREN